MKRKFVKWLIPFVVLLGACSKKDNPLPPVISPAKGVYVLSEGTTNDSKLGFYDLTAGTIKGDFFLQQNPTMTAGLGQYANDMIIYGSKMYIVINGSGNIVVADANTAIFNKRIDLVTGNPGRYPRFAVPYRNKVYVSATDNTVSVIDTATLIVTKTITVGANPEGMAIVGSSLYVANSGGYNAVPDSTVSVVDLNTETEIKKIIIATKNPQTVEVNSLGDVYVSGYGNFTTIPASVSVINSASNTVKKELGAAYQYSHCKIYKDIAYFYNNYGGGSCKLYNTLTGLVERAEFVTDATVITSVYGINIDEQNDDVYITDSNNFAATGSVTCFDKTGKKKFSFSTSPGVGPNKVVFKR
jgi:YVTN family beta-propeller protein